MSEFDDNNPDASIDKALRSLGHRKRLHGLTPMEAAEEFLAAPGAPLSADEIEVIASRIASGELAVWETPSWFDDTDTPVGEAALTEGLVDSPDCVDGDMPGENNDALPNDDDEQSPPARD